MQVLSNKYTNPNNRADNSAVQLFDPVGDIADFHNKFGFSYDGPPRLFEDEELARFRLIFMVEELGEYANISKAQRQTIQSVMWEQLKSEIYTNWDASKEDIPAIAIRQFDALIDLVYVALGTAYLQGFDFREGWRRVHEKNMCKIRALRAEDSTRGSIKYDIIKPLGWTPADLSDLVT
jgi:predicted HAD superfamily Cof-like phosphohydrolase